MEDFCTRLIVVRSISLGRAMTPQNETEMNGFILSLMGEAPAEEVSLPNRLYALMRKRGGIGFSQEADQDINTKRREETDMSKKIVKVNWVDTSFAADDLSMNEAIELKPLSMITFGVLMKDDDSSVNISSTVCLQEKGKDNDYRSTVAIPKTNVITITELGEEDA